MRMGVGELTCGELPHLTCKRDYIKMRDYMDRWVTSPKRVTSPTWGPPPPCKQALKPEFFFLKRAGRFLVDKSLVQELVLILTGNLA